MPVRSPKDVRTVLYQPPEPVTWAGEYPDIGGFCFASESGNMWLTSYDFKIYPGVVPVVKSGEAINGVAFTGDLMAASTRGEVVVITRGSTKLPGGLGYTYAGGAHGIIASKRGKVVAPMGKAGLLLIHPLDDGRNARTVIKAVGESPYYYHTIQLGDDGQGGELFASAGRTDGLILTPIDQSAKPGAIKVVKPKESHPLFGLDVVGLCSLNTPAQPRALAFLGMDGSLHLSADILGFDLMTMVFGGMEGTPYTVHCAQGHLFILTSEKLYAMKGFVAEFLSGRTTDLGERTPSLDVDAVDFTIVDDEYLMIIQENGVSIILVKDLFGSPGNAPLGHQGMGRSAEISSPGLIRSTMGPSPGYRSEIRTEIMEFV